MRSGRFAAGAWCLLSVLVAAPSGLGATFTNNKAITIVDNAKASVYPSVINVPGRCGHLLHAGAERDPGPHGHPQPRHRGGRSAADGVLVPRDPLGPARIGAVFRNSRQFRPHP